jgi:hypothetical protein
MEDEVGVGVRLQQYERVVKAVQYNTHNSQHNTTLAMYADVLYVCFVRMTDTQEKRTGGGGTGTGRGDTGSKDI